MDFGHIQVRARYADSDVGTGPAFNVYANGVEFLRMDFFTGSPQGPHYHLNPSEGDPVASVTTVEGISTPDALRHYLLGQVGMAELARRAGQDDIAQRLSDREEEEHVGRWINDMADALMPR